MTIERTFQGSLQFDLLYLKPEQWTCYSCVSTGHYVKGYPNPSHPVPLTNLILSSIFVQNQTNRNNRVNTCIVHRRINLPVIVTGNGSLASSHLPNGQLLIRRQANTNGLINKGINTIGSVNLTSHCIAINNNIGGINNNNGARNQAQNVQLLQKQIPLKAISWNYAIDVWWDKVMAEASCECEPVWVDAEDPLFILYTR